PLADVDSIVATRHAEADEFYAALHPPTATEDEKCVQRQALAGMLWSKQMYLFDVPAWLDGDNPHWPPPESRRPIRSGRWHHLHWWSVLARPDKWESPWVAGWDLAFHWVPLALGEAEFAKGQPWPVLLG